MPPKRKAKQTTRATPGKAPRHTRLSAALGAPPPPSTSVAFEDAEELQEIVAEVTARSAVHDAGASSEAVVATSGGPSRVAWEQQVDAHMANTDRLLLEMHGMLQSAFLTPGRMLSICLHLPLRCQSRSRLPFRGLQRQVEEFKALAVWADPTPTAVPRHLLPAALSSQ